MLEYMRSGADNYLMREGFNGAEIADDLEDLPMAQWDDAYLGDGGLADRVSALEARLEEQEESTRYLLRLLIEWLDADGRQKENRAA